MNSAVKRSNKERRKKHKPASNKKKLKKIEFKKHKIKSGVAKEIESKTSQYEKELKKKFRRAEDQEHIEQELIQYHNRLVKREMEKDNVDINVIREEEHRLINTTMISSLVLMTLFVISAIFAGEKIAEYAQNLTNFFVVNFGWFYLLVSTGLLIYLFYLALSRFGHVVLGEPDSSPEFGNMSWCSMLFAAGMGVGLLFWGAAEPVMHFAFPPVADPKTAQSAREALMYTAFHWGLHGWGIYTSCAVGIAYFGFRKRKKYLISSCILELFNNKRIQYALKIFSDLTATIAVTFGMAASLGMGLLQMGQGLNILFDIPSNTTMGYGIILLATTVCFLVSAGTGLEKGIKILSNVNMLIAISLMLFLWAVGPKIFTLKSFVDSIGTYLQHLPQLSFQMLPLSESYEKWMGDWTILYFTWWISWAPFVGIFIARISRGRTIREVILGALIIPTVFCLLWFAIFGGTAIDLEWRGILEVSSIVKQDKTMALFEILRQYPLFKVTAGVSVLLIFTFLVTSADSATFVISMMTTEGDLDPGIKIKLMWGIIMSAVTLVLVAGGGLEAIQAAALTSAFPFTFVLILIVASLYIRLTHQVKQKRI